MSISCNIITPFKIEEMSKLFATDIARKHKRSETTIKEADGHATFVITASDVTALRAAVNSVTSTLSMYEKTQKVTG